MFFKFLIITALAILAVSAETEDVISGRKVKIILSPHDWFEAQETCAWYGKRLFEIHTREENKQATDLLKKYRIIEAWFGLNDIEEDGKFVYGNGKKVRKEFWAPGSYDGRGGEQDCVTIASEPGHPTNWFDRDCKNRYPFICQL